MRMPVILKKATENDRKKDKMPSGWPIALSYIPAYRLKRLATSELSGYSDKHLVNNSDLADKIYAKHSPITGAKYTSVDDRISSLNIDPRGRLATWVRKRFDNIGPAYSSGKLLNMGPHATTPSGRAADTLAHELGHAYDDKKAGSIISILGGLTNVTPYALPIGLAGYVANRNKDDKKAKKWMHAGLGVSGAGAVARLLIEGSASLRGMKMLRDSGATPAELSTARKSLGAALGTYAASRALPVALMGGMYALDRRAIKKYGERQNERT